MPENNMAKTVRKPTGSIAIKLTLKERELLLGFLIVDDQLAEWLKQVPPQEEHVQLDLDDLVDLFGWLNAPGNQSRDKEVQGRLDRICDRIQRLLPEDVVSDDQD